jgi:hypothetical protein
MSYSIKNGLLILMMADPLTINCYDMKFYSFDAILDDNISIRELTPNDDFKYLAIDGYKVTGSVIASDNVSAVTEVKKLLNLLIFKS